MRRNSFSIKNGLYRNRKSAKQQCNKASACKQEGKNACSHHWNESDGKRTGLIAARTGGARLASAGGSRHITLEELLPAAPGAAIGAVENRTSVSKRADHAGWPNGIKRAIPGRPSRPVGGYARRTLDQTTYSHIKMPIPVIKWSFNQHTPHFVLCGLWVAIVERFRKLSVPADKRPVPCGGITHGRHRLRQLSSRRQRGFFHRPVKTDCQPVPAIDDDDCKAQLGDFGIGKMRPQGFEQVLRRMAA